MNAEKHQLFFFFSFLTWQWRLCGAYLQPHFAAVKVSLQPVQERGRAIAGPALLHHGQGMLVDVRMKRHLLHVSCDAILNLALRSDVVLMSAEEKSSHVS